MTLGETNFGKIVVELNNFTHLINPDAIADFEAMTDEQLDRVAQTKSFTGEVAKWYQFLIKSMRVVSSPVEAVNPDVDIDENELVEVDEDIPEDKE